MTKTGYVGHGESSHRPYYSDQHMPSAREPTAVCHNNVTRITFHIKHLHKSCQAFRNKFWYYFQNLPPISAVCEDQMSQHSNNSQNNKMDYSSQDRRRYGGATASPHGKT